MQVKISMGIPNLKTNLIGISIQVKKQDVPQFLPKIFNLINLLVVFLILKLLNQPFRKEIYKILILRIKERLILRDINLLVNLSAILNKVLILLIAKQFNYGNKMKLSNKEEKQKRRLLLQFSQILMNLYSHTGFKKDYSKLINILQLIKLLV